MGDTPSTSVPTRDSTLIFREIIEDNWRAVARLSLKDGQSGNLASNLWSICESHYNKDACIRAIYADETLVGMLLMATWPDEDDKYYMWRFMIDGRYQGLGYGRQGVEFVKAHVRQHYPQVKQLLLHSTAPEGQTDEKDPSNNVRPEDSPFRFYEKLGFKQIEPPDEGEALMAIDL